jgi:hypothetical protein
MSNIVSTTRPTPEGEMLWRVSYASSWYDSDERGSGYMDVGATAYVLARGMQEAINKTTNLPAFKKARKDRDKGRPETTTASIVTIESLVPTEVDPEPGMYGQSHDPVSLACPEDAARYRLAVCLVPVE